MKKQSLLILATAALVPMAATASQFHHVPGAICMNSFSSTSNDFRAGDLVNYSTSASPTYSCPIDITSTTASPITVDPSSVRVDYADSNANSGYSVACRITVVTSTATFVNSAWRYSCATAGGCTSNTGSTFTGAGYLTIPDTIAATANVVGMSVECSVPYWDNVSGGTSVIYGIGASTATP